MPKFDYAFDIAFSVLSDEPEGKDVTPAMFRAALLRRIIELDETNTWEEACGVPYDAAEIDQAQISRELGKAAFNRRLKVGT